MCHKKSSANGDANQRTYGDYSQVNSQPQQVPVLKKQLPCNPSPDIGYKKQNSNHKKPPKPIDPLPGNAG